MLRIPRRVCLTAALVAGLLWSCSGNRSEIRTTEWSNGRLMERWEEVSNPEGMLVRSGLYEAWHESGRLRERGSYTHGVRTGLWAEWYDLEPAAKMREGEYVDGRRHGRWTYWHNPAHAHHYGVQDEHAGHDAHAAHGEGMPGEMPVLKLEHLDHGIPDGTWISWYPDGSVADSMTYVNGKLHGVMISYHPNGQIISKAHYDHGVRTLGPEVWDSNGVLISSPGADPAT